MRSQEELNRKEGILRAMVEKEMVNANISVPLKEIKLNIYFVTMNYANGKSIYINIIYMIRIV